MSIRDLAEYYSQNPEAFRQEVRIEGYFDSSAGDWRCQAVLSIGDDQVMPLSVVNDYNEASEAAQTFVDRWAAESGVIIQISNKVVN